MCAHYRSAFQYSIKLQRFLYSVQSLVNQIQCSSMYMYLQIQKENYFEESMNEDEARKLQYEEEQHWQKVTCL